MTPKFISLGKRVTITNFLQFVLALIIFQFNSWITIIPMGMWIYSGCTICILLIDLYVTIRFLEYFYIKLNLTSNSLLKIYPIISLVSRVFVMMSILTQLISLLQILMMLFIGASGVIYGLIIFDLTEDQNYRHHEKLRFVGVTSLLGFITIFGSFFQQLYFFIKVILPLPAGLVYLLVVYDIDIITKNDKTMSNGELESDDLF